MGDGETISVEKEEGREEGEEERGGEGGREGRYLYEAEREQREGAYARAEQTGAGGDGGGGALLCQLVSIYSRSLVLWH